ncbi:hypothetical protein COO60DRAFT_79441 [Scenedesmus sp. NREL 46B-D3]|nr:hypothetical protein COO60DRAFT_79441 [Scenedesmus sp. NREL 46B-D3]
MLSRAVAEVLMLLLLLLLQVAAAAGSSRDARPIPGGAAELAKVRLCLSMLGELLGQPAMRAMTQAVMAGVSVEGELLPRFLDLLLQGPPVAAAAGNGTGVLAGGVAARLSQWRLHRQSQLLAVQEQLAELPYPLEALSGVVDLTIKTAMAAAAQLQAPAAAAAPGDAHPGRQVSALLSSIALHSARASCMALQQLLLLLGCITQLGRVGSTQLTAADQAAISQDEIPRLATALRSAALALWLCKTSASAAVAGAGGAAGGGVSAGGGLGPLLGLKAPTPSGTPAGTPRDGAGEAAGAAAAATPSGGQGVHAAAPAWQLPLAAHLLPLFWKQQGRQQQQQLAGAQLGAVGNQLAVWLMLGAGAEAAAATAGAADIATNSSSSAAAAVAAVTSPHGLAGRAVLLGYQLFACREYEAMRRLVQLIGGSEPSEAGLQFILGLSLACGIKRQPGGGSSSSSGAQLNSAVGHLFRAAAGLTGEEAAPLRLVVQLLRQRQGSSSAAGTAGGSADFAGTDMDTDGEHAADGAGAPSDVRGAQDEAKLKLEFCQAVVLLFEREGVTQGALAFARAALGAVDAAHGPKQQQEKVQQQAALWAGVFNFASELDLAHDAYTAALSNPLPERAAESVRRLVQALVDRGQLQQLLSLPWAGVLLLNRNGLQEPVPVVELVIDKLTRRALHSELSVTPCPHQVLFDFHLAWGNHKAAAAAMLSHARRLRAAGASGKQQRGASLQEAVNEVMAAYAASTAVLQLLARQTHGWTRGSPCWLPTLPRPRISSSSSTSTGLRSMAGIAQQLPVITLQDLQREAALFEASALLLQQLPGLEVMQYGLSGEYIIEQLLGAQQFPEAVQLVHTLYGEPQLAGQLAGNLEAVTFALAGACVKLQKAACRQ